MEVRSTSGGLPVVVADPSGPVALVTVNNYRGRRRLWWVGPARPCFHICRRLGIQSVEMQPHAVVDELLSDEGDTPCN